MKTIRVGSRESPLAMVQARLVMDAIEQSRPDVRMELVTMTTTGDRIQDKSLDAIGGKGLFVKELDEALASGRVDVCVHSYKDMPVPQDDRLPVVAATRREDPRDVLILPEGRREPDSGKPLGTSSLRRRLQLSALFPEHRCEPVRGNVQTRLRKLDAGEYGGLVLAAAGIRRLGLWERVSRVFTVEEMLPAACQGILAVQGRAGEDHSYLGGLSDADAWDAALAERAFIEALGATCSSPVAAFANVTENELTLTGLYADAGGVVHRGSKSGPRSAAVGIGRELAEELLRGKGGRA